MTQAKFDYTVIRQLLYDAFISYARDDFLFAESLKKGLDAGHLRVFLDVRSLRTAQEWPPQLGAALRKSRMMVLCWSEKALVSHWVEAELNVCLLTGKPVLPWMLDSTQLPATLSRTHGISGGDPAPVVRAVARERRHSERRRLVTMASAGVLAGLTSWTGWHLYAVKTVTFRGHVVDEAGGPLAGAAVEAEGIRNRTGTDGSFRLFLSGPQGRAIRVMVRKAGFVSREIHTQSDVPDLGVVLTRER